MADNKTIRDGAGASFIGAADELSDTSFSPKVTLLAGDSSPTPYRIDQAFGALTETAPASDTASSGLNGRLQRIAQRLTSLIALLPTALTGSGNFKVALAESTATQAVTSSTATYADKSGMITTGGAAQTIATSNSARRGFMIQNQSSGDLWFSTLATAVASQPSIRIGQGELYESPLSGVPTGAISLIGATTGQAFAAREW